MKLQISNYVTLQPIGGAIVGRPSKAAPDAQPITRRPWKAVVLQTAEELPNYKSWRRPRWLFLIIALLALPMLAGCDADRGAGASVARDSASADTDTQDANATDAPPEEHVPNDEPAERVTFDDLNCTIQADIVFREWMLSARAKELDGRRIRIAGYIHPNLQLKSIHEFILLKNSQCKFGPGGQADHLIMVKLIDGATTNYTDKPIVVLGTLHFKPYVGGDGNTWGIYEMDGEAVEPMRR